MKPIAEKQQHFLKNKKILEKEIVVARLKKTDDVVEIGAGDGRLTRLISPLVKSVTSYETDAGLKEILENLKLKNVKFLFKNALLESWAGSNKIVSNIPYSLSEPVIMKAIKDGVKELTLIVGEKFAKLLKEKETKIGIISNLYFEIKFVEKISKDEFEPAPRVDSFLIHMKRKKPTEIELVLQSILEKESKTKNAIIKTLQHYGKTKNEARRMIDEMGLDKNNLEKSVKSLSVKVIERLKKGLGEI